ncbi:MAG: ATP-binding protein [Thermoplasmata archaeon]
MKKELAIEVIKDFHEKKLPEIIKRDIEIKIPKNRKTITIIGPRRAGKTYFLFNIINDLRNEIDKTEVIYINLEDDRLLPLDPRDLDTLLRTYYEIYPENRKKKIYLFFDEIQNVPGWEHFIRRIMDTEDVQVFITGSSSKLLAKEIATSMRGRSLSYLILPFSLKEILRIKRIDAEKYLSSDKKAWIMNTLQEYMEFGGFPEVVLEEDKNTKLRILKEYIEVMLMRDLVERHRIKNIKILRMLFNALLNSFSKEFSTHKFYNFLRSQGIKTSKNTLYEYIQYFEDAFAIIPVRRFSYTLREIEQSLPKIYAIDNGYIAQSGIKFSPNTGSLMENMIAVELLRRKYINPLMEFYYWRDSSRKEVDFVIKEGSSIKQLIQSCYNIEDYNTKTREVKSLIKAGKELKCRNLHIITWDYEATETIEGKTIVYTPLWKWLLKNNK